MTKESCSSKATQISFLVYIWISKILT